MYMDEIHDETSRPLTSTNTNAIPPLTPHVDSTTENETRNGLQSVAGDNRTIGFSNADIDNGLLPKRPFSPSNFGISDLLPSQSNFLAQPTPDVNLYQHKKTVAQGMMDLALLSANANQMRYVLQTDGQHSYFYPALIMIGMSLFLQIAVGIGLIWNSRYNVKEHIEMCMANRANNWTVIGIFLVMILNVFISSFGVVDQTSTVVT